MYARTERTGRFLGPFSVHEQVGDERIGFDAALTHEAGELSIVADAVQKRVEEDGFPVGAERPHGTSSELHWLVPIDIRDEELLEDSGGAVMGGVDRFDRVERDSV